MLYRKLPLLLTIIMVAAKISTSFLFGYHRQALNIDIRNIEAHQSLSRLAAAGKGFGKNPKKGSDGGSGGQGDKGKRPKSETPGVNIPKFSARNQDSIEAAQRQQPKEVPRKFQMLYTCNICQGRNLITVDRIAFTEGIVVARCKHCDSKHLVADNLSKLDFGKGKVTLDDILALRGETAKFVDLASNPDLAEYDLEYKDDGTVELAPKGTINESNKPAAPFSDDEK